MSIWLTETGYETNGTYGVDEGARRRTPGCPRDVLLCLAHGMDKVMRSFAESGSDPDRWGSAGVLRTDGSQKPSFFSYATLIRELERHHGRGVAHRGAGQYPHLRLEAGRSNP